jgi:flagellar hook assembly protein FlgD
MNYYAYDFGGRTMNRRLITIFVLPLMLMALVLIPQKVNAGGSDRMAKMVHPNPFTEGTTFQLTMPKSARIRIAVFDMLGELVYTIYEGVHDDGTHDVYWHGKDLNGNPVPPGVYVCTLYSENVAVKSVKVIKAQT